MPPLDLAIVLMLAASGGIFYRVRDGWLGGYVPGGTFGARMVWAVPTALLMGWAFGRWWIVLAAIPAWLVGVSIGWGSYHDLGRSAPTDERWARRLLHALFPAEKRGGHLYDFAGMTIRGLILTAPPSLVIAAVSWRDALVFLICGLALGLHYEIGWLLGRFTTQSWPAPFGEPPGVKTRAGVFIDGGGAWASLCVGIAIWGLIAQWGIQPMGGVER